MRSSRLSLVALAYVVIAALLATLLTIVALGTVAAASPRTTSFQPTSPNVYLLTVGGAIDPITAQYVARGLQMAARDQARAVLIEMDTPGGLDSAMRQITGAMLTSPVPVIVYVTPAGARAGSAGVFITMAADVAAMAPGTNIGAAHPVGLGDTSSNLPSDERDKVTNDAAAYMRMLATTRHHNATWAEEAVRQSVALTADEALAQKVIDLISPNRAALLDAADGHPYTRHGQTLHVQTRGAAVTPVEMTFPEQLLHLIDDPNVAYLLLSIGGWALLAELFHPGSILPGVVGILCLALALTALQSLPMNWTGVALIVIALALFVVDLKATSHGILTAAGLATFIVGSLMLFSPMPLALPGPSSLALEVSPLLIAAIGVGLTAFFAFAVRAGLRARHRPAMAIGPVTIGAVGLALTDLAPSGAVRVHGADWNAESEDGTIHQGDPVQVIARKGLRLVVRRATEKGV